MDSIIFDLDGTLWDSRETVVVAWNEVLKQRKINKVLTIADFKKTMGLQVDEIGRKWFPELDDQQREDLLKDCCELECEYLRQQGGSLYDGVEKVIKVLSEKYKLFIVSNCQSGYIESFYAYHKLDKYFLDYEHPGRTGLSKGENIKLVMERNQLQNPVYVGDTAGDLTGATFAGIPFVFASYGFGEVDRYDYKINKINELIKMF